MEDKKLHVRITDQRSSLEAFVESEAEQGRYYRVLMTNHVYTCTCRAGQHRQSCKHVMEVKKMVLRQMRYNYEDVKEA